VNRAVSTRFLCQVELGAQPLSVETGIKRADVGQMHQQIVHQSAQKAGCKHHQTRSGNSSGVVKYKNDIKFSLAFFILLTGITAVGYFGYLTKGYAWAKACETTCNNLRI
jgi:hypothetical protein